MGKRIWVLCAVVWVTVGFAGCGQRLEDDWTEKVQTPEMETDQKDELMSVDELGETEKPTLEATVSDAEQEEESDFDQEEPRIEPTDEHDRQMLALLDEACGSKIYTYVSVDMDKDGENEMIGAANDHFSVWYCSSDLENCYIVPCGHTWGYDDCKIEQIEFDQERHIVINSYNWIGTGKAYSILALHDGEIEVLVDDNYGYVYMNEENDIILDIEAYDGVYYKDDDLWTTHTWKDTYLYYEDGKYKEYGAATLSEKDFLKYENARELLDKIEEENQNEDVLEIQYSYFIRENGIVHIQCEVEEYNAEYDYESTEYFHYTLRENGNHLDGELSPNYGVMLSSFSQLDEVTYP